MRVNKTTTRILVIEDDDNHRYLLYELLTYMGYIVILAENGEDGIIKYDFYPVDVVITDIFMPKKDGLDVIIELKEKNPIVKIIAISGGVYSADPNEWLQDAIDLGADYSLMKPVDPEELLKILEDVTS